MKKLLLLAALAGGATTAAVIPSAGASALPAATTIPDAITIDTGIRCVTEPCPSTIVIPIPPGKA